jgi:hypothetical protein
VVETYPEPRLVRPSGARDPVADEGEVTVVHPPVAKPGYVEQVHVTYARVKPAHAAQAQRGKKLG